MTADAVALALAHQLSDVGVGAVAPLVQLADSPPTASPWGGSYYTRFNHSQATLDDDTVLIWGGYTSQVDTELYDPVADTWTAKADRTVGERWAHGATMDDGTVLTCGGAAGTASAKCYVYDPSDNTWTATNDIADMPAGSGRNRHSVVAIPDTDQVLAIGGYGTSLEINSNDLYDRSADTWTEKANLPATNAAMAACAIPDTDQVLVVGGTTEKKLRKYDLSANSWSVLTDPPSAPSIIRYAHMLHCPSDDRFYVFANPPGMDELGRVLSYDADANTWRTEPENVHVPDVSEGSKASQLSDGRAIITNEGGATTIKRNLTWLYTPTGWSPTGAGAAERVEPLIAAAGRSGFNAAAYSKAVGLLQPASTAGRFTTGYARHPVSDLTTLHNDAAGAGLDDNTIFIATGRSDGARTQKSYIFDPVANTWTAKADAPTPSREYAAGTRLDDGRVMIVGGLSTSSLDDVDIYDPSDNTWSSASDLVGPDRGYPMVVTLDDGDVLAVGGFDNTTYYDDVELWDAVGDTWTAKADIPTTKVAGGIALLDDGDVFVTGGHGTDHGGGSHKAYIYDTSANSWSAAADQNGAGFPYGKYRNFCGNQLAVDDGKVYVFGGIDNRDGYNTALVLVYDVSGDSWETTAANQPHLPAPWTDVTSGGIMRGTGGQLPDGRYFWTCGAISSNNSATGTTFLYDFGGRDTNPPILRQLIDRLAAAAQ